MCVALHLLAAALLGQSLEDAKQFGWSVPSHREHVWATLTQSVSDYIKGTNWGYKMALTVRRLGVSSLSQKMEVALRAADYDS